MYSFFFINSRPTVHESQTGFMKSWKSWDVILSTFLLASMRMAWPIAVGKWTRVSTHVMIYEWAWDRPTDNRTWLNLVEQPKELTDRSWYFSLHFQTVSIMIFFLIWIQAGRLYVQSWKNSTGTWNSESWMLETDQADTVSKWDNFFLVVWSW